MEKNQDKKIEPNFGPGHAYRPLPVTKTINTTSNTREFTLWFQDTYPPVGLDLMSDGSVRWRTDTQ